MIYKYIILSFFLLALTKAPLPQFKSCEEKFEHYKFRYKIDNPYDKITDNQGNGCDPLYGTRNMRAVLHGVIYRGGANNFYHKSCKRDNKNPLPDDGLKHLYEEGFSAAIYAYGTNYKDAPKFITNPGSKDTLFYIQNSGMSRKDVRKILLMTAEVINNPEKGPIYIHCWNGWHQSGYISAAILMQFCGLTNEEAYRYWLKNTDGINKGYENVKKLIKDFKPFNDIKIDKKYMELICPEY